MPSVYQFPYTKLVRINGEVIEPNDNNKQEEQLGALTDIVGNYNLSTLGTIASRVALDPARAITLSGSGLGVNIDSTALTINGSNQLTLATTISKPITFSGANTVTGSLDCTGGVLFVASPTVASHAASKAYVDAIVGTGLTFSGGVKKVGTVVSLDSTFAPTFAGLTISGSSAFTGAVTTTLGAGTKAIWKDSGGVTFATFDEATHKITFTGVLDPTAFRASGGTNLYYESADGSTAAVSNANEGRIRYLNGTGWQVSSNGGAYTTIVTGGGSSTLTQVLTNGNTTSGKNIIVSTGDLVQFGDTADSAIGRTSTSLLFVSDGGSINKFFSFGTGGSSVQSGGSFGFSPSATDASSPSDTAIAKVSAGVMKATNGSSTGYFQFGLGGTRARSADFYAFTSSSSDPTAAADLGIGRSSAGVAYVSDGGSSNRYSAIGIGGIGVRSGDVFAFATSATDATTSADAGIRRSSAGVMYANDGGTVNRYFAFGAGGVGVRSGDTYGWTGSSTDATAAGDTSFGRFTQGMVKLTNAGATIYALLGKNGGSGSALRLTSDGNMGWGSSTTDASASVQTIISSPSAGVVSFDTTTAGNTAGSWKATSGTITNLFGTASSDLTVQAPLGQSLKLESNGSSANGWSVDPSGHLLALTSGTQNIGASGGSKPNNIFMAGSITATGGAVNTFTGNLKTSGLIILSNEIDFGGGSTSFIHEYANGIISISSNAGTAAQWILGSGQTTSNPMLKKSGADLQIRLADDSADANLFTASTTLSGSAILSSAATTNFIEASDQHTAAVSGGSTGRIRYNNNTAKWEVSTQGSAYAALSTGGGGSQTLAQTLANGHVTGGNPITVSTGDAIEGTGGLLFIGTTGIPLTTLTLGNGDTNATPQAVTYRVTNASGANVAGANWTHAASQGTGTGAGGSFIFQVAPAGTTGSSLNALVTGFSLDSTKLATFPGTITSPGAGSSSEHFGAGSTAAGAFAVAIGNNASAGSSNSIAIGANGSANNTLVVLVGAGSSANGTGSIVVGHNTVANTTDSIAIGESCSASGSGTGQIAIGGNAIGNGDGNVVVGYNATNSSKTMCTVIGSAASAGDNSTVAIGQAANASFLQSTAVGKGAIASSWSAIAIGWTAHASGTPTISAPNAPAIAIGPNTQAGITPGATNKRISDNIGIGDGCLAGVGTGNNTDCIAIGDGATSGASSTSDTHDYSDCIAIGDGCVAGAGGFTTTGMIAIGNGSSASGGNDCIAIAGSGCTAGSVVGDHDLISIGEGSTTAATFATAIGSFASAQFNFSMAFGRNATTTAVNQAVFGGNSGAIATFIVGNGDTNASPQAVTYRITNASGSNIAGSNTTYAASQGTGTGAGGSHIFRVAPAGTTGTSLNALTTVLTLDSAKLATFAGDITLAGNNVYSTSGTQLNVKATNNLLALVTTGNFDIELWPGNTVSTWNFATVAQGGQLRVGADNTYDIGTGALRVRSGFFGTNLQVDGGIGFGGASAAAGQITGSAATVTTSTPLLNLSQTWNAGGVTFDGILANFTSTASAAASRLLNLQLGGNSAWNVKKSGSQTVVSAAVIGISSSATDATTAADTGWSRVSANVSALGNGTAADASGQLNLTTLSMLGKVTTYNNVATAGVGITSIVASGRITAQTGANTITSFTPGADGTFQVKCNLTITASSSFAIQILLSYTDRTGAARNIPFHMSTTTGNFVNGVSNGNGTGAYPGGVMMIDAQSGTTITIATTGTFTSVTYNADAAIEWVA